MKADLISVIIPAYNRSNYIKDCINSVVAQSYENLEIIIVDDGSTDATPEICRDIAKDEPRIKNLTGEHGGVSAARNIAIDNASGEYLFFIDSDDVIHPFLLEAMVDGMKKNGADIAGTRVLSIWDSNWNSVCEFIAGESAIKDSVLYSNEESLDAIFKGNSPIGKMGGVMMKRTLVGDTRFRTDLSIGEDFYFNYENLIKGASCSVVEEKWYYARMHDCNISWDYSFKGFWSRFFRRVLVWESEEKAGRTEYANLQKRDAFGCFIRCAGRGKAYSKDSRKMRKVMREYKKNLFPGLSSRHKAAYYLYVYFPYTAKLIFGRGKK